MRSVGLCEVEAVGCCYMLLLVTSLQSSLCSALHGVLSRVKQLNLGDIVTASYMLLVSTSICVM